MLTENAFAYNRGKHIQITQAISQGRMGRCAMIWRTAGTNRVCSRCLALKDTIVGYTDETGVTLPPLHPRCRCSISYDEVGRNERAIRTKLEETKTELKIKGELKYPPPRADFSSFVFDAAHTQGDRHPHDVSEEEARKFINEAYFAIVKYNGNSYNYFGKEGAAYVRLDTKAIRTAFKSEEYDSKIQKLIEVFENEIGNL